MKHYMVIETTVSDPSWVPDYLQYVTPIVETYGGHFLSRTSNVALIEGDGAPAQFSTLIEFPTKESAEKFYNSAVYQPYKKARQAGSTSRILLLSPAE